MADAVQEPHPVGRLHLGAYRNGPSAACHLRPALAGGGGEPNPDGADMVGSAVAVRRAGERLANPELVAGRHGRDAALTVAALVPAALFLIMVVRGP
jgi:hypothetical protein